MVRGKFRVWSLPLTQKLTPVFLRRVIEALFPTTTEFTPPTEMTSATTVEEVESVVNPAVSRWELDAAIIRLRSKRVAPGPDGVPGRVWVNVLSHEILATKLANLFTDCLTRSHFPEAWKVGHLVLLHKEGRPVDSPSAYRPIVLLDEVGKLFERVIASRLINHLNVDGPDLSENQFGFRQGRSTLDAIMRVRCRAEEAVFHGKVVLAVSLDICNAFNTLPWACIREALKFHRVPLLLRRIIDSYLSNRVVSYSGREGQGNWRVSCGVPQGSVLGPLLWNIGYDWVLRDNTIHDVSVVCYADDTLVMAGEQMLGFDKWQERLQRPTAGHAIIEAAKQKYGGIDILVSNAAVNPAVSPILDTDEKVWDKIFDVNVKCSWLLAKEVYPELIRRGGGNIVFIASIAGYQPMEPLGPYSVSKTTLIGLSKAIAKEVVHDNIRVNCVAPGVVETKFASAITSSDIARDKTLSIVPMNRYGKPSEIAGAVAFLVSDDASYMTGETLVVAGGTYAHL
ncbi:unnamed protein product [Euphydryas editha]|uniref:Reverse transcriptase domain-containing protein n=1 Tax=Euphydryas editha TaxID=104508 RepID=A0AAU9U2X6_EUPED|nr:unnamed protein product [Euphydryas editha]